MRVTSDERSTPRARLAAAAAAALLLAGLAAATAARAGEPAPSGEALFLRNCATCHLGRGSLIGSAPLPDLLSAPLPRGDSVEALTVVIRNGTGAPKMPAFREGLSDAEIAALVGYLRERRAQAARSASPSAARP
jgi:mono/diheme cytochrome c family protein